MIPLDELELHRTLTWAELGLGAVTLVALLFVVAPYGRTARAGFGPTIPSRLGWILMESPASLLWLYIYLQGQHRLETVPLVLLGLWQLHYVHRAFVFPFRMRLAGKTVPVLVPVLAIAFNTLNAYVNARWVSELGHYTTADLTRPTFIAGVLLFLAGLSINLHADEVLRDLRKPGETGYKIPQGGLHRLVAAPNYFGEILEWCGWALAMGALPGWAFAFYTFANLAPRAAAHRRWYRERFPDYPAARRRLVPFLW
jgi:3-oxo-5-alpha-steroid 4-dehydrogenase 1